MSMTESDAIRRLKDHFRVHDDGRPTPYLDEAVSMAISALEELQKIKELGDCYIIPKNSTWEVNGIDIHKALEEIQQYRAIGTVSEFRELKEKATAKQVFQPFGTHSYKCPTCWKFVAHEVDDNCDLEATMAEWCPFCGQKLDWSEGKE